MSCRVILHEFHVERQGLGKTTEWQYWIEGDGVQRPATPVEIEIYTNARDKAREHAISVVAPFGAFVTVERLGGTPEQALRKAWKL